MSPQIFSKVGTLGRAFSVPLGSLRMTTSRSEREPFVSSTPPPSSPDNVSNVKIADAPKKKNVHPANVHPSRSAEFAGIKTGFKRPRVSFNTLVITVKAEAPRDGNLASMYCFTHLCTSDKDTRSRLRSLSLEDKSDLYLIRDDLRPPGFRSTHEPRRNSSPRSMHAPSIALSLPSPSTPLSAGNNMRDSLDCRSFGDLTHAAFLKDEPSTDSDDDDHLGAMRDLRDSITMQRLRSTSNIFESNEDVGGINTQVAIRRPIQVITV